MELIEIDWMLVQKNLILIGMALLLALPVGYNREKRARAGGLRTYPLVSVATCSYTLLALSVLPIDGGVDRMMAGIITGVGFIGGGAILKFKDTQQVTGMASAASIWNTGAIGMSVAWQRFEIAILIAGLNFLILAMGARIKQSVECEPEEHDN